MNLMILSSTFSASFVFVFLKAFQQRNVAFDNYHMIIPVSLVMAFAEFAVIHNFIKTGYNVDIILAIGLGSGSGALLAALCHKKWFMKKAK